MAAEGLAPNQSEHPGAEDCFRQICESDAFRSAPAMRNLLNYLWTQRGRQISEYAIGVDVLGRQPDFESKTDASVRVAVARLRGKLKEFYEEESQFPLRVTIPRGSHELKWSYAPPSEMEPAPQPAKRAFPAGGVSIALAVALVGWAMVALYTENRTLRASVASLPAPAPLPRFWRSFLSGARPVVVIVPNPLYLVWPNRIYTRDLKVSRFADWPSSPFFADLAKHWGEPTPSQTYVGAVEMLAATRLVQYLERGQQVELVDSSRFSADAFASQNTISLGMPRTAAYLDRLLERTNFYLAQVEPDIVRSRNPLQAEPSEFVQQRFSAEHAIHPGILICLPARPEKPALFY